MVGNAAARRQIYLPPNANHDTRKLGDREIIGIERIVYMNKSDISSFQWSFPGRMSEPSRPSLVECIANHISTKIIEQLVSNEL